MAHGGKRPGSGRKAGAATTRTREIANAIAEGLTPLEYLTSVYRDLSVDEAKRIDAAKAAAPYVHAKLSSVEMTGKDGGPVETIQRIERHVIDPSADTDRP